VPDTQTIVWWVLTGSVGALATVLWWLGRYGFERLDAQTERMTELMAVVTALRTALFTDMAAIRERLARIEGHIWPHK